MNISLRDINETNIDDVLELKVRPDQEQFVAPNAVSLAQAYVYDDAWPRAIYLNNQPVGFIMLSDPSQTQNPPPHPKAELWRFMIDHRHQRKGVGKAALDKTIEHIKTRGYKALYTSYFPDTGSPEPFYRKYGFEPTGDMDDKEIIMLLKF